MTSLVLQSSDVHAIVERTPGAALDEDQVISYCQSRIAGYKCPRSVRFADKPLPLSAAGKVLKAELRRTTSNGPFRVICCEFPAIRSSVEGE